MEPQQCINSTASKAYKIFPKAKPNPSEREAARGETSRRQGAKHNATEMCGAGKARGILEACSTPGRDTQGTAAPGAVLGAGMIFTR